MSNVENLKSINGRDFLFEVADRNSISVISAGYIITPDGYFISILDNESHSNVFSDYLNQYLENKDNIMYELFDAISHLTEYGHIIYFGIKPEDMVNIYSNLGNSKGFGVFIFPPSMETLPDVEKEACIELIDTNSSIFGNREKIELNFNQMNSANASLDKSFVLSILHQKNKQ